MQPTQSTPHLITALILGVGLIESGCPASTCNTTNCAGCCDSLGVCQAGTAESACGPSRGVCVQCGMGMLCGAGQCATTGSGGGSGAGRGGGGGGAVASGTQELVSGSRLRAVSLVSADGTSLPMGMGGSPIYSPFFGGIGVFWDRDLKTYCRVMEGSCTPLSAGWTLELAPNSTEVAVNPAVGALLWHTVFGPPPEPLRSYVEGAPLAGVPRQYFLVGSTPYSGPLYNGTQNVANDGGYYIATGAPVSLATFTPHVE